MDFIYTTKPKKKKVYHVLFMCPEAQDIKKRNRVYREPLATDDRQPCEVCRAEVEAWLASL